MLNFSGRENHSYGKHVFTLRKDQEDRLRVMSKALRLTPSETLRRLIDESLERQNIVFHNGGWLWMPSH